MITQQLPLPVYFSGKTVALFLQGTSPDLWGAGGGPICSDPSSPQALLLPPAPPSLTPSSHPHIQDALGSHSNPSTHPAAEENGLNFTFGLSDCRVNVWNAVSFVH